jgi:putative acetyltransferase
LSQPHPAGLCCRREAPDDLPAIRDVIAAAFGRTNEAALVDALRTAGTLSLSGVAELDGRITGHIAYTPVQIHGEGESAPALALAPMAVHPNCQRHGVGTALIEWSLAECRRDGHELVIVLGHANFYSRFGFVPARPQGIRCPFEVPDEVFRVRELKPGALGGRRGTVRYPPEFARV